MTCSLKPNMKPYRTVAVVGGGPAGLRAAELIAQAGASVSLFDAMPSVGRKFLVAGKSGLNLTNAAEFDEFAAQYSGVNLPVNFWREMLADFDNYALGGWAEGFGIETFVASSGKVFPVEKKAAPILRRWVLRLRELGVEFRMRHRWVGLKYGAQIRLEFEHQDELYDQCFDAVVLALGGASWPQTGSTGTWTMLLERHGVQIEPMRAANCGWECDWTDTTRGQVEGQPLHNLHIRAGDQLAVGELMVTRYGFEGTPIYGLGPTLRAMDEPAIEIDFKPTFTVERLVQKMESARRNFYHEAKLRWKLNDTARAILQQLYGDFDNAEDLARAVKACRIPLTGPRPLQEAISTAGGIAWAELDDSLMLKKLPDVFCAGEMIDWEAPTGGFLLQGCFATGTRVGKAVASLGIRSSD